MAGKPEEKTPWETLSAINLADKIEKKNGLSYISWAWAWGALKQHYPHAWYRKHDSAGGYPCFHDVAGYAFVKVTVGLDRTGDNEVTETFPVLDHRNKPIQGPTSFDINNALQRCLAKAIAYHGLGHYIYAGEDLPADAPAPATMTHGSGGGGYQPPPVRDVSAPPQGLRDPILIYGPDGSQHWIEALPQNIAAGMISFIPLCADDTILTRLYSMNRTARQRLEATGGDLHGDVIKAFSDAKQKLTTQTQGA